jgi:sulfhydrogenase subunit beta (sulfur reductase)
MSTVYTIQKKDMLEALKKSMSECNVAALTTNEKGRTSFEYITTTDDIVFDYAPSVLPPKKFFFPQEETLLKFSSDGEVAAYVESTPTVLFGVRPCDLNGIKILLEAFSETYGDPNVLTKREDLIIIGIECGSLCDEDAFCYKVKSNEAQGGYDILLIEKEDHYLVVSSNFKGREYLEKYVSMSSGKEEEVKAFYAEKKSSFKKVGEPFKNLDKLPELFAKNKQHPVWKEEGDRCLSCGSCVMVCPTCYCFDVVDEWKLNLKDGERIRRWDGCMLRNFTKVAGGELFREEPENRLHHRINRKFNYLMKKHGMSVCVGCGRCVKGCLADISPKTIAEAISEA